MKRILCVGKLAKRGTAKVKDNHIGDLVEKNNEIITTEYKPTVRTVLDFKDLEIPPFLTKMYIEKRKAKL